MKTEKDFRIEHPELDYLLYEFYTGMKFVNAEQVFSSLSPNLSQIVLEKQHEEKFQKVFLFGSNIRGALINKLALIKPGFYDAVVIVCRIKDDDEINAIENLTGDDELDNLRFRIYRVKFIEINAQWYIDDIFQDNESLSN